MREKEEKERKERKTGRDQKDRERPEIGAGGMSLPPTSPQQLKGGLSVQGVK